jgi:decaprenylphospho-beta-D-erythro-pentofuranosid-2-ulose 2-reductase
VSSAVVIGASSGLGRALARRLAEEGVDLVVVSREPRDLEPTAADIVQRYGVRCFALCADIADPALDADAFAERCGSLVGEIERVFIPVGAVSDEDVGANPTVVLPLALSNYAGPARLAAAFCKRLVALGRGQIVLFSSIAAGAPRTNNVAYSAAKAALEVYARGLRHFAEPRGVTVTVYALGYVDTPMSFGRKLLLPIAAPHEAAAFMTRAHRPGKHYYPRFWWWVLLVLKSLPWAVYRRLSF